MGKQRSLTWQSHTVYRLLKCQVQTFTRHAVPLFLRNIFVDVEFVKTVSETKHTDIYEEEEKPIIPTQNLT